MPIQIPSTLQLELCVDSRSDPPQLYARSSATQSTPLRQRLLLEPDTVTFVFNSPAALQCLASSDPDSAITVHLPDDQAYVHGFGAIQLAVQSMQDIRVGILAPIGRDTPLTYWEVNGELGGEHEQHGAEKAPTLTALDRAWRGAFMNFAIDHALERVTFDLGCEQVVEVEDLRRLLQFVGTLLYLKRFRSSLVLRPLRFRAAGVSWKKQRWLEEVFPNELYR